jgi:exopolysaccharide biosynthesis polyprenyl glycosylphosphotransferase
VAGEEGARAALATRWSLRVSERRLLLAGMDLALLNVVLALQLGLFHSGSSFPPERLWLHVPWFLTLSGMWLLFAVILDVYDLRLAADWPRSVLRSSQATVLTLVAFVATPLITPVLPQRRVEALLLLCFALSGIAIWRILYGTLLAQSRFSHRTLIVGTGKAARVLAQVIAEVNGQSGARKSSYGIVGFLGPEPEVRQLGSDNLTVLGGNGDLVRLVQQLRPDEVVIAVEDSNSISPELLGAVQDCREMGIQITTFHSLFEGLTGRVPVEQAGAALHVIMPVDYPVTRRLYLALKRGTDIAVSFVGCAVTVLITPVVWLLNQRLNPGPLFYRQQRVGKGGRLFEIVKFRSMVANAEEHSGAVWATEHDSRVPRFGRFLRKSRLDELPQFWNVLRGEMTLIGPRPERPEFVRMLSQQIPFYRLRHAVKPGITGWAQIKHRYGNSVDDALIKLQYDLYYIKHKGPLLDLVILLRTVSVVLLLQGT